MRDRLASPMNATDIRKAVQRQIDRAKPILGIFGPEIALRVIYDNVTRVRDPTKDFEALRAVLRELKNCFAALQETTPRRTEEWLALANELGLNDIERVLVAAAALSRMPHETVWTHFFLTESLNRLVLSGVTAARVPCIFHALLTLMQRHGDRAHEALPHAVLARELGALAPRDAVGEGIAAILRGSDLPYHQVIAAARTLGIADGPAPALLPSPVGRPDINYLKSIADQCDLTSLQHVSAVRAADATEVSKKTVIDAETRNPPVPHGDSNYYLFRDAGKPVELPPISVYEIHQGTISFDLDRREFYVFDATERCIGDLSWGLNPFIDAKRHRVDRPLAVLGDRFSGPMNICHFLLDHFARIAIYQKYTDEAFLCLFEDHQYFQEIARIAGFTERIFRAEARRYSVTAERLLVSSNLVEDFRHPGHLCASWTLDFLRQRLVPTLGVGNRRKLYISRADARTRNIVNQAEVEAMLSRCGFEAVTLGHVSAAMQIELFQTASHVVGVHGAGLTNVLFAPPGAKVLEILPPFVATQDYWLLCAQAGHFYRALIAEDPEFPRPDYRKWSHHPEYNDRNLIVPLDRLKAALDSMDQDP